MFLKFIIFTIFICTLFFGWLRKKKYQLYALRNKQFQNQKNTDPSAIKASYRFISEEDI